MALHPEFPASPYELLRPDHRWCPADETWPRTIVKMATGNIVLTDIHRVFLGGPTYRFVYVDQKSFEAHRPTTFQGLVDSFREYQA